MTTRVFLDSGIFIAFLERRDQWHEQAVALFDQTKVRLVTSLLVVSETYSWFLHRHGEEQARTFGALVDGIAGLRLLDIDAEVHRGALRRLDRFRGSKLTYVDAASLHLMGSLKIVIVWSTDYHLGLEGAQVLPRV